MVKYCPVNPSVSCRVAAVKWRRGFKVRVDQSPGRILGIMLARLSSLYSWT
jgi:hypothetical protein